VLEGIFALYDPRVLELLDMGVSDAFQSKMVNPLTICSRSIAKPMRIRAYPDEVSANTQLSNISRLTSAFHSRS
jgi:hypothetical protein